jgi:hypothetical protein
LLFSYVPPLLCLPLQLNVLIGHSRFGFWGYHCSDCDRVLHGSTVLAVTEPYTDFFKRTARWVRGFLIYVRPILQISVLAMLFSGWLNSVYVLIFI